ncbi:MAG TPA: hypothetical protein VK436_17000 [Methanocella sp.]|nr:hypothetical protein [Methanocella sp.]
MYNGKSPGYVFMGGYHVSGDSIKFTHIVSTTMRTSPKPSIGQLTSPTLLAPTGLSRATLMIRSTFRRMAYGTTRRSSTGTSPD